MPHPHDTPPCGRLILVLDDAPYAPSLAVLRRLLQHMERHPDITLLAGPHHRAVAAAMSHDDRRIVYNTHDELTFPEALGFLPWRHIYAVAHGRLWNLAPAPVPPPDHD